MIASVPDPATIRHAVRAILMDPDSQRILLMRAQVPEGTHDLWLTPGGGMESGESREQALQREVWEETGRRIGELAPPVWIRRHDYEFRGVNIDQHETFYFVPTMLFRPTTRYNPAEAEMSVFREFRWWSVTEIQRSEEIFVPLRLADHLQHLLVADPPTVPIDVGH
jgi:8-oxo-dGTP pyrophosphatase MutT (NUDIX family)